MQNNHYFAPSLMCMDFMKMEEQLAFMNDHADYIHVDIMDVHFVRNITLSPIFINQIRKAVTIPIDAHLMVEYPEDYVDTLIDIGTDCITLHIETLLNKMFRLAHKVRKSGRKLGIAVSPETDMRRIRDILHLINKVTIMTVEPGYSGGDFIPEAMGKIREVKDIRHESGYSFQIEVDGSCSRRTFKDLYDAGAEVFVVGASGLFSLDDEIAVAWEKMATDFREVTSED